MLRDWEGNEFVEGDILAVYAVGQMHYPKAPVFADPITGTLLQPKAHVYRDKAWVFKEHMIAHIVQAPDLTLVAAFPSQENPQINLAVPLNEVASWWNSSLVYCKQGVNDNEERVFREYLFKFSDN
jgi:hypothetical protein